MTAERPHKAEVYRYRTGWYRWETKCWCGFKFKAGREGVIAVAASHNAGKSR